MTLAQALREPPLRERLAVALASEIVSGRMQRGKRFPSAEEVVEEFGVSRTVARETVQTLSMLGLVHVQHGRRTEVLPSDNWNILSPLVQEALRRENAAGPLIGDLYEFRLMVEPRAAALVAERGSDSDVDDLKRLAADMLELVTSGGDAPTFLATDREFHKVVARASRNRILAAVSRDIGEVLTTLWALSALDREELHDAAKQHARVVEAIGRRDPLSAAEAMREHLEWAEKADLERIRARRPAD